MKLPIGRTIACVFTAILLAVGAVSLRESYRKNVEVTQWHQARPIDIPVDLSKTGEFSGEFVQTCQISHDEALCLLVPQEVLASTRPANLLDDLRFTCQIVDQSGKQKISGKFQGSLPSDRLLDGAIQIVSLSRFNNGVYKLTLTVTQGASALRGVEQRLIARYKLCGLEELPSVIALIISIVCFAVAAFTMLIVALVTWQKRTRRQQQPSTVK